MKQKASLVGSESQILTTKNECTVISGFIEKLPKHLKDEVRKVYLSSEPQPNKASGKKFRPLPNESKMPPSLSTENVLVSAAFIFLESILALKKPQFDKFVSPFPKYLKLLVTNLYLAKKEKNTRSSNKKSTKKSIKTRSAKTSRKVSR